MPLGASFVDVVPLVKFIYLVFTRTPGGVTVGDSGLSCCVPCLSSAVIWLCLLTLRSIKITHCSTLQYNAACHKALLTVECNKR